VRYFFLIIAVLIPVCSAAQLTAPGRNAVRYTSYPSPPGAKDPVFIYCSTTGSEKGTLSALRPKGSGVYDYSWFSWNETTKSFSDSIKTDAGVASSTLSNVNEGGYRVKIRKAGIFDTSLVGWVFVDKPYSLAALKNRTCDYVALKGTAAIDTFYYKNPSTGSPVKLPNGVRFLWSSNPSSSIPFPDFEINPLTFDPPLVDVRYKLQVNDSLGCISESSFDYVSIHVKADFTVDPAKGEAPLEVTFTDKSIRESFMSTWEFGEKLPNGKKVPDWVINKDSLWVLSSPFTHTYNIPGEYSAKLTIVSDKGCIDSLRLENKIIVVPSELKIPNVFTPDGDGLNDYFAVESKSLRYISVEVFSRSGVKVYAFFGEGKNLKDWKGWDGNINNSSAKATPGVYYYVIHGYGWDDKDYNSKDYRGFVYLYR
jgi:gliding motility-associated-like protein